GHSSGGLRLAPDLDEAELSDLARAMTLKYGFLGMPQGGAKAGVIGDYDAPQSERRELLVDFAQAIAPLLRNRIYLPGADIGTDSSDMRHLLESVGIQIKRREFRANHSGYYTALTVFVGAQEAARHMGLKLSGCSVAIEGFGKVGSALAGLMDEAGARIVAISTARGAIFNPQGLDVGVLTHLAAKAGSHVVDLYQNAQRIPLPALLELPVDVLCPCARRSTLHAGNSSTVQARIISAGANCPVTPKAEQVLFERGIVCLPDFVTNSGGCAGGQDGVGNDPTAADSVLRRAAYRRQHRQLASRVDPEARAFAGDRRTHFAPSVRTVATECSSRLSAAEAISIRAGPASARLAAECGGTSSIIGLLREDAQRYFRHARLNDGKEVHTHCRQST
ncbi:MAG TPA: Glu/Leu/Phe/Val dehydrogenase dimerization domain-containing protein, partial [Chloroflexota bacterium]|nr:Glu/Leu/Phe/Val dehydrogenase dimerization domain-containing protein [Chloroflexota bacterium]